MKFYFPTLFALSFYLTKSTWRWVRIIDKRRENVFAIWTVFHVFLREYDYARWVVRRCIVYKCATMCRRCTGVVGYCWVATCDGDDGSVWFVRRFWLRLLSTGVENFRSVYGVLIAVMRYVNERVCWLWLFVFFFVGVIENPVTSVVGCQMLSFGEKINQCWCIQMRGSELWFESIFFWSWLFVERFWIEIRTIRYNFFAVFWYPRFRVWVVMESWRCDGCFSNLVTPLSPLADQAGLGNFFNI